MTPEEAAAWSAEHPRDPNPRATLNKDASCMLPRCMAPIYLDEMCADHWRLLMGYPRHACLRELRNLWEAS